MHVDDEGRRWNWINTSISGRVTMLDGLAGGPSMDRPSVKRSEPFAVTVHALDLPQTSVDPITTAVSAIFNVSVSGAAVDRLRNVHLNIYVVPAGERFSVLPRYAGWQGKPFDVPLSSGGMGGFFGSNEVELWLGGKLHSRLDVAAAPPHLIQVSSSEGVTLQPTFVAPLVIREEVLQGARRYGVITHELGHAVHYLMLTGNQRKYLQYIYGQRLAKGGPWILANAGTNVREYFAEATSAFFAATPFSTDAVPERYTRSWLAENDPKLYAVLRRVYPRFLGALQSLETHGDQTAA